jgi:hypothetical protein
MLREHRRRGRAAATRHNAAGRVLQIWWVWMFHGVIHIGDGGLATFAQRVPFFLSLLALRNAMTPRSAGEPACFAAALSGEAAQ